MALYLLTVGVTNAAMDRASGRGWWVTLASVIAVGDAVLDVPALAVAGVLAALLLVVVVTGLEQEAPGSVELEALWHTASADPSPRAPRMGNRQWVLREGSAS